MALRTEGSALRRAVRAAMLSCQWHRCGAREQDGDLEFGIRLEVSSSCMCLDADAKIGTARQMWLALWLARSIAQSSALFAGCGACQDAEWWGKSPVSVPPSIDPDNKNTARRMGVVLPP